MPYVNIKITREGVTADQKAALIRGVTQLLADVLGKNPKTSVVTIDEIDTDNWGLDGITVTETRQREKANISVDLSTARTAVIGDREWTAENLNIKWPGSWPPNGDEQLAAKYGRLYTYEMAVQLASRASGWRLPNKEDVEALIAAAGGLAQGAEALKAGGKAGFEALYAGFREPEDNTFRRTGQQTGFWTSLPADEYEAWKFWLRVEDNEIRFRPVSKLYGDSVRFVREK